MEEVRICDCCGAVLEEDEEYSWLGDDLVCDDCRRNACERCENCDELIYDSEAIMEDGHFVCYSCHGNSRLTRTMQKVSFLIAYICQFISNRSCSHIITTYHNFWIANHSAP